MAAVKYSPDFNWSQSPSTGLATAGAKTVNLAACVAGVVASEPQYYVYVAGTGNAGSGAGNRRNLQWRRPARDAAIYDRKRHTVGIHHRQRFGGIAGSFDRDALYTDEPDRRRRNPER